MIRIIEGNARWTVIERKDAYKRPAQTVVMDCVDGSPGFAYKHLPHHAPWITPENAETMIFENLKNFRNYR